jgi:pSer/pThr/pTyr-binding forkhead associated (FHA) protein
MAAVLRITVETGPHKGTRYCLSGSNCCLIGRDPACVVQLTGTDRDRTISRRHCQLVFDPDELALQLQDLGSQNGTYLNGQRIERVAGSLDDDHCASEPALGSSNVLTIGGTTLRLDLVSCPPAALGEKAAHFWAEGENVKKDCPVSCQG